MIAVNDAGMTTEIPVEFFRQLVLLMWDYALTSSNGGGEKSLAWGLGRIYRLAHLIQKSARSTGIQAIDDVVISLLSLLSFQTSSSLQGLRDSHFMYQEVREMLSACALKHLILPSEEKSKGNLYSIAQSTANFVNTSDALESTNYQTVVNSLCQDKAKSKRCREVEAHWSLSVSQESRSPWEHIVETPAFNLSLLIHESWEDLALSGFEAMSLPVSLGNKLILCMSIKAILNIAVMGARDDTLSSVRSGIEPIGAVSLFPIETVRWALTMKAAFLQPSASALNLLHGDSNVLMRRILSSSDNLPFQAYTAHFCDFQLTFRLTLVCVAGFFDHFSSIVEKTTLESEILEATGITLLSLLRMSDNNVGIFKDSKDIFKYLDSDAKRNTAEAIDSYFFYEMVSKTQSSISPRGMVQTICSQALDVVAGLVSRIDRNTSTTTLRINGTAPHSSGERRSLFTERVILTDFRLLVSLSRELQKAVIPLNIPSANNTDWSKMETGLNLNQNFESLPGKEKKADVIGAKRSTVLFDRSSAVWRLGALGSRDRVLASMRAVQSAPLSGVRVHLESDDEEENSVQNMEDDDDSGPNEYIEDENSDNDDNDDFLPFSNSQTEGEMDWTPATEVEDGN